MHEWSLYIFGSPQRTRFPQFQHLAQCRKITAFLTGFFGADEDAVGEEGADGLGGTLRSVESEAEDLALSARMAAKASFGADEVVDGGGDGLVEPPRSPPIPCIARSFASREDASFGSTVWRMVHHSSLSSSSTRIALTSSTEWP